VNQTVNITKIQVSNRRVINEGPRPDVIERKSGKKIEAVAVRELRGREERAIVNRRGDNPPTAGNSAQPAVRTEPAPSRVVPAREPRVEQPPVTQPTTTPATRNE